jgi:hypothetical protein
MAAAPASSSAASAADSREEIVFLDVETSTPPRVLLEFGAVVVCSRRLVDVSSYATLVRPADPDAAVPDPTARCSGITRDAVADAPPFRDVADKVYDVLHGEFRASSRSSPAARGAPLTSTHDMTILNRESVGWAQHREVRFSDNKGRVRGDRATPS